MVTSALALLLGETLVCAQPDLPDGAAEHNHGVTEELLLVLHGKIDGDGDGLVSLPEALEGMRAERRVRHAKLAQSEFESVDSDENKKIMLKDVDLVFEDEDAENPAEDKARAEEERKHLEAKSNAAE